MGVCWENLIINTLINIYKICISSIYSTLLYIYIYGLSSRETCTIKRPKRLSIHRWLRNYCSMYYKGMLVIYITQYTVQTKHIRCVYNQKRKIAYHPSTYRQSRILLILEIAANQCKTSNHQFICYSITIQ